MKMKTFTVIVKVAVVGLVVWAVLALFLIGGMSGREQGSDRDRQD